MNQIEYLVSDNLTSFSVPITNKPFFHQMFCSVFLKKKHPEAPWPLSSKSGIVGISTRPLTDRQKNILNQHLPLDRITDHQPVLFDVEDISNLWSIDFLSKLDVPNRVLFSKVDALGKHVFSEAYLKNAFKLRLPVPALWEYALEATRYFQYVILVTELCNLRCIQCPFHSQDDAWIFKKIRPKNPRMTHLSLNQLNRFLEHIPKASSIRLGANGEPFLHPDIFLFLERLKKDNHEVAIQTNGSLLTEEHLNRLADLSIDQLNFGIEGTNPEAYGAIRQGGSFSKVLAVLDACMDLKRRGRTQWLITINYSLLPHQSENPAEISNFFRGHADRINFAKAFVDPCCEHTFDFAPEAEKHISNLPNCCFTILHGPVLGPTGLVFPCGLMSNAEWFVSMPWLKNIDEMPLPEIMEHYKTMIRNPESEFRKKICQRCTFWTHAYRKKGTFTDAYYHTELL